MTSKAKSKGTGMAVRGNWCKSDNQSNPNKGKGCRATTKANQLGYLMVEVAMQDRWEGWQLRKDGLSEVAAFEEGCSRGTGERMSSHLDRKCGCPLGETSTHRIQGM